MRRNETVPHIEDVLLIALTQRGDRYVLGAEASAADPNPPLFDCSELVEWACKRAGVRPTMPDGSGTQTAHCYQHGTLISSARAIRTRGALLFRTPEVRPGSYKFGHVAFSLGDGSTFEARGARWGVNSFPATGRTWTHGALIPGVTYTPRNPLPPEADMLDTDHTRIAAEVSRQLAPVQRQLAELTDRLDVAMRGGKGYQAHPVPDGGLLGAVARIEGEVRS